MLSLMLPLFVVLVFVFVFALKVAFFDWRWRKRQPGGFEVKPITGFPPVPQRKENDHG
jgi:hypothetical protein